MRAFLQSFDSGTYPYRIVLECDGEDLHEILNKGSLEDKHSDLIFNAIDDALEEF